MVLGYFWLNTLMFMWAQFSWALRWDSGPHAVADDCAGAAGSPVQCEAQQPLAWYDCFVGSYIKRKKTDFYIGSIQKSETLLNSSVRVSLFSPPK